MALNEIYKDANELVFPVAEGTVSGDLVAVGTIVGVAQQDAIVGEDGGFYATLKLNGAFQLTTADADIAPGTNVYVTALGAVTETATGNKFIGHAVKSGTDFVVVRLVQAAA